jgi:hypothetical protein
VDIIDIRGKLLAAVSSCTKVTEIPLNYFGISPGHYFVRVVGSSTSQIKKLIVQ